MKKIIALLMTLIILTMFSVTIFADNGIYSDAEDDVYIETDLNIRAKSAILMDAKTGTVLYQLNGDEPLSPASVTKIMTLLLVAEAIESGKINLNDKVLISSNAASMGGSQIFLEEGEEFTVEELLKSTVIASANDASVALAELVSGSEDAFVSQMNKKAREMGLRNTNFENTTGLDDTTVNHVMSAYDIALISKELIKYDFITKYSSLWQDSVRDGAFTLTNTNRLVRYYSGCTGLKTGSTDKAGFCVTATAKRGEMHLIAVIMGAETRDIRNECARTLLDYGFATYGLFSEHEQDLENIPVLHGTERQTTATSEEFYCLVDKGMLSRVEKKYNIPENITAPIRAGEKIGEITYILDGKEIGKSAIYSKNTVNKITTPEILLRILKSMFIGKA